MSTTTHLDQSQTPERPLRSLNFKQAKDRFILGLALVIATYLMSVSILATQLFDPKLADLSAPKARLDQSLSRIVNRDAPATLKQFSTTITVEFGNLDPLLQSVRQNSGLGEYIRRLAEQLKFYADVLGAQPKAFAPKAKEEFEFLMQQFDIENHDHFGIRQAQAHVDDLIRFFEKWVSDWGLSAKKCRDAISTEVSLFTDFTDKIKIAASVPDGKGDFPPWPNPLMGVGMASGCDFDAALSNSGVPKRKPTDESLGPIGRFSEWLLRTESRDIAIMTGLFGFGLFGAVSATFIRPSLANDRSITTIFVRGMAAAILVYLVVIGGLAVFTRESIPNPYAVYFACLVAAVFSDDVWQWARQRQQESFAAEPKTPPHDQQVKTPPHDQQVKTPPHDQQVSADKPHPPAE
jgi:hypothetical protein